MARLAALVPKPSVNLSRYHGVFAPHSSYRARVTPAKQGTGSESVVRMERSRRPPNAARR